MTPRLHHVAAARSFRVLWMLCELGEEPDIVHYAIPDGSLRRPEFLAVSPAGRVPALEIDGRVLFESGAILEYLAETRPAFGLGRAAGHPERPEYLTWIHFAETQAHVIANLNLQHLFLRDPADKSRTVLKLEAMRLARTLAVLEQALDKRDWLLPGGFSTADVMLGYNLFAVPYYVQMDPYPRLAAYRARIEARPAYRRARDLDGEQAFYSREFYSWED